MSTSTHDRVLLGAWLIMMALLASMATTQYWFYRRLRFRHPSAWRDLGAPHFLPYRIYLHAIGLAIKMRDYEGLGDPVLTRLARATRIAGWAFWVPFVVGMVLIWYKPSSS